MRAYETFYITRPDAAEDKVSKIQDKVNKAVKAHKGTVLGFDDWGTRKLAYDIQKNSRGRMVVVGYCAQPTVVADLERELRLDDLVVRYTTRVLGDGEDTAARKKDFQARIEQAKANKEAEEERAAERAERVSSRSSSPRPSSASSSASRPAPASDDSDKAASKASSESSGEASAEDTSAKKEES